MELSGGTFRLEIHDVLANDEHVVILSTAHAERNGKTVANNGVQVAHVRDGRLVESWLHAADQYAVDEFWS
jgi:ketosteroid isomerase-like protein